MTNYLDDAEIPDWAREAAEKAEAMGFGIPKMGGTLFRPFEILDRAQFITALDKFGLLNDVIGPPPPPPPPPPLPGNALEIIASITGTEFIPKVTLPHGHVGAFPDAEVIRGPIVGQTLFNKVIHVGDTPPEGFITRDCVLHNCTINGGGMSFNAAIKGDSQIANCLVLDVGGDGLKVGGDDDPDAGGEHVTCRDSIISMHQFVGAPVVTDKHYDGAQAHVDSSLDLERVVFLWNGIGYYANSTAAIFTQGDASVYARNITILDPGGTYQIIRLQGSGTQDVDRVHVVGRQRLTRHGRLAPTHIVKSIVPIPTLFNEVPGAGDWLVYRP